MVLCAFQVITLYSVCLAFRKVPDITHVEIIDLVFSMFVNSRNAYSTSVDITPLCLGSVQSHVHRVRSASYNAVPVKFPNRTFREMLLSGSDVFAGWQVCDHLLSYPSTRKKSCFGVRETPFDIGYDSIIGTLST